MVSDDRAWRALNNLLVQQDLIIAHLHPGIRAPGDGELWAQGSDRGAPSGEAAAHGDAQSPPTHLHCEDWQCQNARERGQPSAGAAIHWRQVKPGKTRDTQNPDVQTSTTVAAI